MALESSIPASYVPIGSHNSQANLSTDQQLGIPSGANGIIMQALTQNVRIRLDGGVATASVGFQIRAGDPPVLIPLRVNSIIHVIQEAATASLQWQWVGYAG